MVCVQVVPYGRLLGVEVNCCEGSNGDERRGDRGFFTLLVFASKCLC